MPRARYENRRVRTLAFLLLLNEGARGRYSASSLLGLGQGVLRELYRELKGLGLIEVKRGGAIITDLGKSWLKEFFRARGILGVKLLEDVEAWGFRYRGVAASLDREIPNIVAARDAAVRSGATMVLIAKKSGGGFYLPLVEDRNLKVEAPSVHKALEGLPEGTSYIVVLGSHLYSCVRGLLSAAALAEGGKQ
jgi:hypothetical protein